MWGVAVGVKHLPLREEPPPPLPPARRSWGWWRCGAAGSGEGQSGHRRRRRRRRRGPAPARRASGRAGVRAPRPARAPAAAPGCQRAGTAPPLPRQAWGAQRGPRGLFTSGRVPGGHPQTPQPPRSFVCLQERRGTGPSAAGNPGRGAWGNLLGAAGAAHAEPGCRVSAVPGARVGAPEEERNFPRTQARLCARARGLSGPGVLAPRRLSGRPSPRARGLPRTPVNTPPPLLSDPLLRGPVLPAGSAGGNGPRGGSASKCLLRSGSRKQSPRGLAGLWCAGPWSTRRAPGAEGASCWGSTSGARAAAVPRGRVPACQPPPRGAARPRGPPGSCQLRARGAWMAPGLCQADVVRSRSQVEVSSALSRDFCHPDGFKVAFQRCDFSLITELKPPTNGRC